VLRAVPPPDSAPSSDVDVQPRTTDAGNARAFLDAMPDAYRYVVQWLSWIRWTGTHWQREGAELEIFADVVRVIQAEYAAQRGVVATARADLLEASKAGVGSPACLRATEHLQHALALLKFLHGSQNTAKVKSAIVQLQAPLAVPLTDLDQHPWYLNCANGTCDLRTGDVRPHDPADLITLVLPLPLNLEARAPTWTAFLHRCMKDRIELALYIQRLVGYTMTSENQEHLLVFCYGTGSNGKSTFLNILRDVLGPYGVACPRTLLFAQKSQVHPTELATLYGRRLGVCSEIGENDVLDEAKVKDLTGGDVISTRRMNENFWDFEPTHKLWIGGNHKPTITGTDNGIWRRMRLVPWDVNFDLSPDKDKGLRAKLRLELAGILAWAVHGCLDWQKDGLMDPDEVTDATHEYREQSDPLGDFFRSHLVFAVDGRMTCRALRKQYQAWCEDLGHLPLGARRLGARLRSMGCKPSTMKVDGKVVDAWAGVRQLADFEPLAHALPDDP
jgi:putative DNA primase/helicase